MSSLGCHSHFYFAHCKICPHFLTLFLLSERLGLRVEAPVANVEKEEADGEDDARVLVDDVDVLDARQRLLHHARTAFQLQIDVLSGFLSERISNIKRLGQIL